MKETATVTVCPICGGDLRRCKCRLSPEQSAILSDVYKRLTRLGGNGRERPNGGGNFFACADEDTHTDGPTRGIEPAPQWVVDGAAKLIGGPFDLDVAALAENAKAPRYFTPEDDGLKQKWTGRRIWCNPPYHLDFLAQWVRKAYEASQRGATVVCLLPLWVGYAWFRDYVSKATIYFIPGFGYGPRGIGQHDCILVILRPNESGAGRFGILQRRNNDD